MLSLNIEKAVINNKNYRKVLYTDAKQQLVVMSLEPGEDIPLESHNGTQFFRIEHGKGSAIVKKKKILLKEGTALFVPKNIKHYIKNTSNKKCLKFYSIYSPPQHHPETLHKRQPCDH
jgi:mannose-6-phosphate isomerase-like protein (cupin superfamily)